MLSRRTGNRRSVRRGGPGWMRWRRDGERGSVLALVPAGFLVLILLGAIAVDSASTFQAQEQLADAVTAAANDAAGAALSDASFYRGGTVEIDPDQAAAVVCQAVAAQGDTDLHDIRLSIDVEGAGIRVHADATTNAVFGQAIPGVGQRHVQADATATAAEQNLDAPPPPLSDLVPISC
jgi:hypothetical protein